MVPVVFQKKPHRSLTVPTKTQKFLELVSLKMNNLRSSSSRSQMSTKSDTVNKKEVSITNVGSDKNWQN